MENFSISIMRIKTTDATGNAINYKGEISASPIKGGYILSANCNGYTISRKYYGYSRTECLNKFRECLTNELNTTFINQD